MFGTLPNVTHETITQYLPIFVFSHKMVTIVTLS